MATDASFSGVRVKRLDDEGSSQDVYKNTVTIKAEYDPKGMMVNLLVIFPRSKLLPNILFWIVEPSFSSK